MKMQTLFIVALLMMILGGCASKQPYNYHSNWQYSGQYGSQDLGRGSR